MADKTQGKATRREVLAFIALQDLPAPMMVQFHSDGEGVGLTFGSIAALGRWVTVFTGHELTDYRSHFTEESSGRPMVNASSFADWRGRHLYMSAAEYVDCRVPESLDEDTTAALREIAGGDQ